MPALTAAAATRGIALVYIWAGSFLAPRNCPDCVVGPAGLRAASRKGRHSTSVPSDGESPGHCER
ncbi:MAG: hypothetical protein JWM30_7 [Burkholderia sp.]|nr:hypothetical protein [Burkholderia sp.]